MTMTTYDVSSPPHLRQLTRTHGYGSIRPATTTKQSPLPLFRRVASSASTSTSKLTLTRSNTTHIFARACTCTPQSRSVGRWRIQERLIAISVYEQWRTLETQPSRSHHDQEYRQRRDGNCWRETEVMERHGTRRAGPSQFVVEKKNRSLASLSFPAQPISFRENGRGGRVKSRITRFHESPLGFPYHRRKRCARLPPCLALPSLARRILRPTHLALRLSRALLSSPWHAISSTPPATRAFTVLLVIFSAANAYLTYFIHVGAPYIPYLTLVPSEFLRYPWTLISAGFVETHFFEVRLSCPSISPYPSLTILLLLKCGRSSPFPLHLTPRRTPPAPIDSLAPPCPSALSRTSLGALETLKFITMTLTIFNASALAASWFELAITGKTHFLCACSDPLPSPHNTSTLQLPADLT